MTPPERARLQQIVDRLGQLPVATTPVLGGAVSLAAGQIELMQALGGLQDLLDTPPEPEGLLITEPEAGVLLALIDGRPVTAEARTELVQAITGRLQTITTVQEIPPS